MRAELHELLDQALDRAPHVAASLRYVLQARPPDQKQSALAGLDVAEAGLHLLSAVHNLGAPR